MRRSVPALGAGIVVLGPATLAFFSGGFFERPRLIAALVVWLLVVVAAVFSPRALPRGAAGIVALTGLTLLCLWTALSYQWAPLGERAIADIQRLVLYLGYFVVGMAMLREPVARRWCEPLLTFSLLVVSLYGLSDRLVPGVLAFERSTAGEGRLEQPLTYWNATGCLSAIGLVLCLRLAAARERPRWVRAAAAAAGPPLGLAVYLSFSRGALLALALGVVLLVVLAPSGKLQMTRGAPLLAMGAVGALVASLLPRVESIPPGQSGDPTQGLVMLVALLILSAGAGATAARTLPASAPETTGLAPGRRKALVAAVLVIALGGLAAVAALEGSPTAKSAGSPTSASRFGTADTVRYAFWDVALEAFAREPVLGTGTGGFAVDWRRQPGRLESAVDAHSLYIETLSELGLVGAALLLLFMAGVLVAAARLYSSDPAVVAGPAAALMVWAVHAGLDWDWEMPALTGVALLLAAAIVAWQDQETDSGGLVSGDGG